MSFNGLLKVTGYYDDEGVDPEPLAVAYFISADYARTYAQQIITAPESKLATAYITGTDPQEALI